MNQVLVVEEEDSVRETLVKVLSTEGHGVITASDGRVALNLLTCLALSQVKLSLKEYRLLELFLSSPRRVWSRQELLEQVWETNLVNSSKTLEVHR
jgi:DNA-binding response OmpR family regulator